MALIVGVRAGGSLPRDPLIATPGMRRRLRLAAEILLIFIGAPILITYAIYAIRVPLLFVLPPLLLAFVGYLLWDRTFLVRRELSSGFSLAVFAGIVLTFLILGAAIAYGAKEVHPGSFLSFPRRAPDLWLTIMALYPILSVLPQEFMYRTFFFHRYGPLFGDWRWTAIVVNAGLFGFGHIVFGNWVAVAGTFLVGLLLAYRYDSTRSLWAVWIEHSLYGCLVFTVGLGRYFFTGISTL
jgi:membrane protease YdiL (CAAX protease family)